MLPEPFDGFMIEPIARFVIDNPTQFPIVKAPVQTFEALAFSSRKVMKVSLLPVGCLANCGFVEAPKLKPDFSQNDFKNLRFTHKIELL